MMLIATIGLAHADAAPQSGAAARAQIEQVVENFRTAIIAKDKVRLGALFIPTGSSWVMVIGSELYPRMKAMRPSALKVQPGSLEEFVNSVGAASQQFEEKFSNLRIHTDGAIAAVYFNYAFLIDGKERNRGSESWHLVNTGNDWKISGLIYSIDSATLE
jgi:hypothetical protein